jgi:quercetin dioxygenase-like cupin family protein
MEPIMKRFALAWITTVVFIPPMFAQDAKEPRVSSPTSAQDATVAAARNYKVEYENDLVRIVRVIYGPHEKSPMHTHNGSAVVIVVLKGGAQMHSINEDGTKTEGRTEQAGAVRFVPSRPAFAHSSENATDFPLETIRVELKTPQTCVDKAAGR